jgi:hypothetical protein
MKTSMKAFAGLVLVAGALVASGTVARAGEGGTAGSIGIKFSAGLPTSASTSISVGKNGGASSSRTDASDTFTSALGSNGAFTLLNAGTTAPTYTTTVESAAQLGLAQANSLTGGASSAKINNPGPSGTVATVVIP